MRDAMPKVVSAISGRIVRSSPTIPPTKALTRTSSPNCCQLALSPSRMEDDSSEFVVAISGDGTAVCPGFQIGRVPFRPKALLVQLNNLMVVGRCRRDSTQYPCHKVTHWQVQTLNSLPDFG